MAQRVEPVLVFTPSDAMAHVVDEIEEDDARFRFYRTRSWMEFEQLAPDVRMCVVSFGGDAERIRIRRLALRCPELRIIALIRARTRLREDDIGLWASSLLSIPCDWAFFRAELGRVHFLLRHNMLRRRIADCSTVHPLVRMGLRLILTQGPAAIDEHVVDQETLPTRTIAELAALAGVGTDKLSREMRAVGISVPVALDQCLAVAVLAEREFGGTDSWDELAWRCGYRSMSGLSGLFRRAFDLTLRQSLRLRAVTWLEYIETTTLRPLWRWERGSSRSLTFGLRHDLGRSGRRNEMNQ